jgi:hypothetical protein
MLEQVFGMPRETLITIETEQGDTFHFYAHDLEWHHTQPYRGVNEPALVEIDLRFVAPIEWLGFPWSTEPDTREKESKEMSEFRELTRPWLGAALHIPTDEEKEPALIYWTKEPLVATSAQKVKKRVFAEAIKANPDIPAEEVAAFAVPFTAYDD